MDIWTMDDLFDYLDIYTDAEKKATTGETVETLSTADEMEGF